MGNFIKYDSISQVEISESGDRWLKDNQGNYSVWNRTNKSYQPISLPLGFPSSSQIFLDSEGNAYFLGKNGSNFELITWDTATESFNSPTTLSFSGTPPTNVSSFAVINNELWLTANSGDIYQFTSSSGSYNEQPMIPGVSFSQVAISQQDGIIWSLDTQGNIFEWDGNQFNLFSSSPNGVVFQQIYSVDSNQLYALTEGGSVYQWSVLAEEFVDISDYVGDGTLKFTHIQVDESGILYGITTESQYQVLDVSEALSLSQPNSVPSNPTTTIDKNGTIHAIWNQNGQIYHGYQPQGTQQFLGVAPLSGGVGYPSQGSASNLSLTQDSTTGDVHAFWTSGSGDNEAIYHSQVFASPYGGYQWSNPSLVSTTSSGQTNLLFSSTPTSSQEKSTLKIGSLDNGQVLLTTQKQGQTQHQMVDLSALPTSTALPNKPFTPKGDGFVYRIKPKDLNSALLLSGSSGLLGDDSIDATRQLPGDFTLTLALGSDSNYLFAKTIEKIFGKDVEINFIVEANGTTRQQNVQSSTYTPYNDLALRIEIAFPSTLSEYVTADISAFAQGSGFWDELTPYPSGVKAEAGFGFGLEVNAIAMSLNALFPGAGEFLEGLKDVGLLDIEAGPALDVELTYVSDLEQEGGDPAYFFELATSSAEGLGEETPNSSLYWLLSPDKFFSFFADTFTSPDGKSSLEYSLGTGVYSKLSALGGLLGGSTKTLQTEKLAKSLDDTSLEYQTIFTSKADYKISYFFFSVSYGISMRIVESKGTLGESNLGLLGESLSGVTSTNITVASLPNKVNYEPTSVTHFLIKKDLGQTVITLQAKMGNTVDSSNISIRQDIEDIVNTIQLDIQQDTNDLIGLIQANFDGDIGQIQADINTGIEAVIKQYSTDIEQINQIVERDIDAIQALLATDINTILDDIKHLRKGTFKEIKQDLATINTEIATDIGGIKDQVKTDITGLLDTIKQSIIDQVIADIKNDFKPETLAETKAQIEQAIADDMSKNLQDLTVIIQTDLDAIFNQLKEEAQTTLDNLIADAEKALGITIKNSDTSILLSTNSQNTGLLSSTVLQSTSNVSNIELVDSEEIAYTIAPDGSTVYGAFAGPADDTLSNLSYLYFVQGTLTPGTDGTNPQISWNPDTVTRISGSAGANQSPSIAIDANNNLLINWEYVPLTNQAVQTLANTLSGNVYVVFGKDNNNAVNLGTFINEPPGFLESFFSRGFYWTLNGENLANFGQSVTALGDLNGQGKADFAMTAPDRNQEQGGVYLVFSEHYNKITDPTNLGSNGVFLTSQALSEFGYSIHQAGDFNGDGKADLIIGSPGLNGDQGAVYLVYGGTTLFNEVQPTNDIDALLTSNPAYGLAIQGNNRGDRFGTTVSGGYDLNGDGKAEIAVSSPNANQQTGMVTVYSLDQSGNLKVLSTITNLTSTVNDLPLLDMGSSVAVIPDINGDGIGDLVIGGTGAAIVLFGRCGLLSAEIDLENVAIGEGFILQDDSDNIMPLQVSSAGDVNGDGINDLIVGYPMTKDSNGNSLSGHSYVLFGGSQLSNTSNNLLSFSELDGSNGFTIQGAGSTVASAGDVNGDGAADLIVADFQANDQAGVSYVIYGGASNNIGTVATIDVTQIGKGVNGHIIGQANANQQTGTSISAVGDLNGDGKSDLLIGAPQAIDQTNLTQLQQDLTSTYITGKIQSGQLTFDTLQTFPYLQAGQSLLSLTATDQGFLAIWNENTSLMSAFWANNQWQPKNLVYQGQDNAVNFSDLNITNTANGVSIAWVSSDSKTGITTLNQSLYDGTEWISTGFVTYSNPTPPDQIDNIITSDESQDADTLTNSASSLLSALNGENSQPTTTSYSLTTSKVKESEGKAYFLLRRTGDTSQAAIADYRTEDMTATAGADYEHTEGQLTFAPGETSKTIEVVLKSDVLLEHLQEKFNLVVDVLGNENSGLLGATQTSALTLTATTTLQDEKPYINLLAIDSGFSMQGPQNAQLGSAIAQAEDVDGDRYDDFFIGASGDNQGQGSLYLVAGANAVQVTDQDLDLENLPASQGLKITGIPSSITSSPQTGYSITQWGNYYAIAAPNFTATGGTGDSQIYVFNQSALNNFFKKQATVSINQLASNPLVGDSADGFGETVLLADLDRDGIPELIVGLPLDDKVKIYTLGGSGTSITSTRELTIKAPTDNLAFGSSLEVSDFNGDGHLDLAIGASNANPVQDSKGNVRGYGGAVYLWDSKTSQPTGDTEIVLTSENSATNWVFNGGTNFTSGKGTGTLNPSTGQPSSNPKTNFAFYDGVGSAIAVLDFNGDGHDDLVMGAPDAAIGDQSSTATPKLGKVYILFGGQTAPSDLDQLKAGEGVIFEGVLASGQAGYSVANAGDVNNDGIDDLLIASPFAYGNAGGAYLVFGSTNAYHKKLTYQLDPNVKNSRVFQYQGIPNPLDGDNIANPGLVGIALGGVGDINGDKGNATGGDDIVLGAPSSNDGNGHSLVYTAIGHPWLQGGLSLNVQDLRSDNGFILLNKNPALPVGDVNGDGFDDFINIGNATPGISNQLTLGASTLVEVSDPRTYNLDASSYELVLQENNLALYNTTTSEFINLSSTPFSSPAEYALMQSDGNFVIYGANNTVVWASGTNSINNVGSYLSVGVDGSLYLRTDQFQTGQLVKQLTAQGDPTLPQYTLLSQNQKLLVNHSIQSSIWNSNSTQLVTSGDFNGDGYQDLVSQINYGSHRAIAVNSGGDNLQTILDDSNFSLTSIFPTNVQQMVTGDINGDGYEDLVILSLSNGNYQLSTLLGSSDGLIAKAFVSVNLGTNGGAIAVADVNNDGLDEITFLGNAVLNNTHTSLSQNLSIYQYNTSFNSFTNSQNIAIPLDSLISFNPWQNTQSNTSEISVGDFNGDGYLDLLASSFFSYIGQSGKLNIPNTVIVYGSQQLSKIGQQKTTFGGFLGNNTVAVGDVNADGFDDILFDAQTPYYTGTPNNNNLNWLQLGFASINQSSIIEISDGTGSSSTQIPIEGLPKRNDSYQINAAGDINGDGYDDFLMSDPDYQLTYAVYGQNWEPQPPFNYNTSYTDTYTLTGTNGNDVFQIPTSFNQTSEAEVPLTDLGLTYQLIMQNDGNLVLYAINDNQESTPVWATGTNGTDASYAIMQTDGNLVLYNPSGQALWASSTKLNYQLSSGIQLVVAPSGQVLFAQGNNEEVHGLNFLYDPYPSPNEGIELPYIPLLSPNQKLTNDLGITAVTVQGMNGDDYATAPLNKNATYLFNGGEGNDTFGLPGTDSSSITKIDGGTGFDTLFLPANLGSGNSFDLTKLYQCISSIEQIDLGYGNSLTLDRLSLLKMTDSNNTLIVNGINSQIISLDSAGTWQKVGSDSFNSKIYDIYTIANTALHLWIQQNGVGWQTGSSAMTMSAANSGTFLLNGNDQNHTTTVSSYSYSAPSVNAFNPSLTTQFVQSIPSSITSNVHEIGIFKVDNDQGYIGNLSPDSPDYLQAAISQTRTQSLLSVITDRPNGFDLKKLKRVLDHIQDSKFGIYVITDSTMDAVQQEWEDTGKTTIPVLLSTQSSLDITELVGGEYQLSWTDTENNVINTIVVDTQGSTDTLAIGSNLQGSRHSDLLDLRELTGYVNVEVSLFREAGYDNTVGFYAVDPSGQVVDPLTGLAVSGPAHREADFFEIAANAQDYQQKALQYRTDIALSVENQSVFTQTSQLLGGFIYAPFIVQNGSFEQFSDSDLSNDPSVFFPYLGVNSDKVDHIRLLGNNLWGFEDLTGGGDRDYNDMIVKLNII